MSSSIFVIFVLLSLLLPSSHTTYEPSGPPAGPVRKGDAAVVMPLFVGRYLVTDSRLNELNVSSVELLLENEVPTLRFNAADGALLTTLQANVCSGVLLHKPSGHMYLRCYFSEHAVTYRHYFHFERVASDSISPGRFLVDKPMPVSDGILLRYQMKIAGVTMERRLALRRVESQ